MTLGERIYERRAARNLSQTDLADALGVSRQSVSKWETDASIPELDKLLRLAELFGVTLDELVEGGEPTPASETAHAPARGVRLGLLLCLLGAVGLFAVGGVMLLAPVLVIMGFVLAGRRKESGGETGKRRIAVPWFAFGFIGIICLNSLLQYLFGVESVREIPLNGAIEYADTFLLTMAMTALGTETSIDKFRQAGAKPFVLAGLLYVWLVAGGYFVTKYVVGML